MKMKKKETLENLDTATRNTLVFNLCIYGLILMGFVFTRVAPQVIKDISSEGRVSEASSYVDYGNAFLIKGQFEMAISQFEKAYEINPDAYEALVNLSIVHTQIGNLNKALEYAKKALTFKNKPKYEILNNIAEIYSNNKQLNQAVKYLEMAAAEAPFPIYALHKSGELLNNLKKYGQAKEKFKKAIANRFTMENCYQGMLKRDYYLFNDPAVKTLINERLAISVEQTDLSSYDETIFNYSLESDGVLAGIYNQYGYSYAMEGRLQEAKNYFELAVKLKPEFEEAKKNLRFANQKLRG